MNEQYTERARRVVLLAGQEAKKFGSSFIEGEHLLLGLLREDRALFDGILRPAGAAAALDSDLRTTIERKEESATIRELPMSHQLRRVLAYAAEEAERLGGRVTDTSHLLLGLLREQSGSQRALAAHGLDAAGLREVLAEGMAQGADRFAAMRARFAVAAGRLAPENEPAAVYRLEEPTT